MAADMALLDTLAAQGGDVSQLRQLAAAADRELLVDALRSLGITKLGQQQRLKQALLRPSSSADADTRGASRADSLGRSATLFDRAWDGVQEPTGQLLQLRAYCGLSVLKGSPPVYLCEQFLTDDECDTLRRVADPMLLRSKTAAGVSHVRTSRSCLLDKDTEPCPALLAKVSALTGKPVSHMEPPQLARYETGQFYGPHYDGGDEAGQMGGFLEAGGQRVCTVLIYLNDVAAGGATRFERLGIEVRPRRGLALIFFPGFTNGVLHRAYLHEALPAIDTKYVCQVWVRQGELPAADERPAALGHQLLSALLAGQLPAARHEQRR